MQTENLAHVDRVPSLDGLRAISALFVVFEHLCLSGTLPFYQTFVDFGNLGVRTFFLISGFIITTLLCKEKARTGTISLRGFYTRRCFRILPIWATYLGLIIIGLSITQRAPPLRDVLAVLSFNSDYLRPETVDLGHMWSLSVEEKFYLLWPLIMVFTRTRTAVMVALVAMITAPAFRLYEALGGASYNELLDPFHNSCDAIATGCLLGSCTQSLRDIR